MSNEERDLLLLQNAVKNLESPDFDDLKRRIEAGPKTKLRRFGPRGSILKIAMAAAAAFALIIGSVIVTQIYRDGSYLAETDSENGVGTSSQGGEDSYLEVYNVIKKLGPSGGYGLMQADGGVMASEEEVPEADMSGEAKQYSAANDVSGTAAAGSHGETNLQVQGVDEADIVKNDGEYIYTLTNIPYGNQEIVVVKSSDLSVESRIEVDELDYVTDMYVSGDRLVTIGQKMPTPMDTNGKPMEEIIEDMGGEQAYYNMYQKSKTHAVVYDISDMSDIKIRREYTQDGDYISSRLVAGSLYIISTSGYFYAEDMGELRLEDVEILLPHTLDTAVSDKSVPIPANCIEIVKEPESVFTVVSGLDIVGDRAASSHTVLGPGYGATYATASHLYVTSPQEENTEILRYSLKNGEVAFELKAEVPGGVLNQFSMDEYGEYFRIATTKQNFSAQTQIIEDVAPGGITKEIAPVQPPETENNLYVLDASMKIVGKIEGLAKGEVIQSVRFMGDMAYVVTFRQVDPLFAIDLSNPKKPSVMGQLKIPGFTSYMHPLDENTLLGIGYDGDEIGVTPGFKVSIFDVSDPVNPKETSKLLVEGDCFTYAAGNHKAVTYIEDEGILAIPFSVYQYGVHGGATLNGMELGTEDAGALILNVDKSKGVSFKGIISDARAADAGPYAYEREISRITYVGDTFYTVSQMSVISADMDTLEIENQLDFYETDPQRIEEWGELME